jgi:hypothetical protein
MKSKLIIAVAGTVAAVAWIDLGWGVALGGIAVLVALAWLGQIK